MMPHKLSCTALLRIALTSEKKNSGLLVACAKKAQGGVFITEYVCCSLVFVNTTDLLIVSCPP